MTPRKNAMLYVAFGVAWIFLSDKVLSRLHLPHSFEVLKGLAFVVGTGILVYFISRRFVRQVTRESEAARRADEKFRLSVEKAPVGIAIIAGDKFRYLNPTAVGYFGIGPGSTTTEGPARFCIPVEQLSGSVIEIACKRMDGTTIPLAALGMPIDYEGDRATLVFVRDLTEERHKGQWLESLANSVPAIVWVTRSDGSSVFLNEQWEIYCGEGAGKTPREFMHPDERDATLARWAQLAAAQQPFEMQMRLRRRDGEYRWQVARAAPVWDRSGNVEYWFGVTIDIEDNVRASLNLERVREAERARIARELHDDLAQALVTAKLQIELAECPDCPSSGEVQKAKNHIARALESTRSLATMLRPPLLDQVGLAAALEWLCSDFEKRTKVVCRQQLDPDALAAFGTEESRIAIFRMMQEALSNVARHARATEVSVAVNRDQGKVLFEVKDNGVGFDSSRAPSTLGLTGVRERARLIGALVDIRSGFGEGTQVRLEVPVPSGVAAK
ncbi:MAG: PAS domain S-box protein [Bryobacterales bacterium]|nr:PAS domain S-box protein [Bryobacterales bacterium]